MSADLAIQEAASKLRFSRTVEREMLHRVNLTEVFLTDLRRVSSEEFSAAALLPTVHPHYTSRVGVHDRPDPMLLLECCRQAETAAAHEMFGVPRDTSFVMHECSMELAEEAPVGRRPLELTMTVTVTNPRVVAGRTRGLDYTFEMWTGGQWCGRARLGVGYIPADSYSAVRSRGRSGPPPSSDSQVPVTPSHPVEPARVGRLHATDTLLGDVVEADGLGPTTAALRVPVENPSMFDHAQDHVPGMVLIEAARQLATLRAGASVGGEDARARASVEACGPEMTRLDSTFSAYAELDAPVTLSAVPVHASTAVDATDVEVTVHQSGGVPAWLRLGMALAPNRQVTGAGGR